MRWVGCVTVIRKVGKHVHNLIGKLVLHNPVLGKYRHMKQFYRGVKVWAMFN